MSSRIQLQLEGMTCAGCARTIENALATAPGTESATVNFATQTAQVHFNMGETSSQKLIAAVENVGYHAQIIQGAAQDALQARLKSEQKNYTTLRRQLIIAVLLGAPVIYTSMNGLTTMTMRWVSLALTALVLVFAGGSFFTGAFKVLKVRSSNMNVLVALGTGAAFLYSAINTLFPGYFLSHGGVADTYFETVVVLVVFLLVGRVLEARSRQKTAKAVEDLIRLQPQTAMVVRDGIEHSVATARIEIGETVRVRPGEQIPLDGLILSGESTIDEAMMTGESVAISKKPGDSVMGGTQNQLGTFLFQVTKAQDETTLAHIIRMVQEAQGSRAPIQRLADLISGYFVPVVVAIAILSAILWLIIGPDPKVYHAVLVFISVLIVSCPCALGLATPTAVMVGIGRGASEGIVIKNGETLELAGKLTTVIFDKTGTLTVGKPTVVEMTLFPNTSFEKAAILHWAASLEAVSTHVYADAIVRYANTLNGESTREIVTDFKTALGHGVSGTVANHRLDIGNATYFETLQLPLIDETAPVAGQTAIYIAVDQQPVAVITLSDALKPDALETIQALKKLGLNVAIISGDHPKAVEAIAQETGIDTVLSTALPADKAARIQALQSKGEIVAMVGDGINDAPALAQADIGIALGAGTDIAMASGDMTLIHNQLLDVVKMIRLSRQTMRVIRQNLFFAFLYNMLALPIAAGALFPATGMLLNPMIAGAAMALSSLSVVSNSLRLHQVNLSK